MIETTSTHAETDALAIAVFVLLAFFISGVLHVLWLRHPVSAGLNIPLDGGLTFRGKRLFGDNKTVRGLVVIIPATGLSFLSLCLLRPYLPAWISGGIWDLPPSTYLVTGLLAGFGFMAGELPNSFIKRQCGVPPGAAPRRFSLVVLTSITDRIDSLLGVLLMMTLVVPVPWQTWIILVILAPAVHSLFSFWLFRARVKARAG